MRFDRFLFNTILFVVMGGVVVWLFFNRPHITLWSWVKTLYLWLFSGYMGSRWAEERRLRAIERAKPLHVTPQYNDYQ